MRTPKYLSPTQLMKWNRDKKDYFMNYLSEHRPPRMPQTRAMAIGAAFDAKVKSYLSKGTEDFTKLFESQVEKHNWDWAHQAWPEVWELYKESGVLQDLVLLLSKATSPPKFESRIVGEVQNLMLNGVPDVSFSIGDLDIILDWKVNGYMSKASPKKGYIYRYPKGNSHKDVFVTNHYKIPCISDPFEDLYPEWALQLCTYSWLLGKPIINRSLVIIHQIAWPGQVAVHSGLCSDTFQQKTFDDYMNLWKVVHDPVLLEKELGCTIESLENVAYTMLGDSIEQQTYRDLVR